VVWNLGIAVMRPQTPNQTNAREGDLPAVDAIEQMANRLHRRPSPWQPTQYSQEIFDRHGLEDTITPPAAAGGHAGCCQRQPRVKTRCACVLRGLEA